MGISDNLKNMSASLQQGAKNTTVSISHKLLRLISGFFIALVLSLIIQEMMQSGTLMLLFFTTLFTALIYSFLGRFSILQILIFDLFCVLIVSLMRLYIMAAP
jgi:hypothetical protein